MLVDAGAVMVIVGHSERRQGLGEDDAIVRAKASAALDTGMETILCVGEPVDVRKSGGAIDYVLAQIDGSLPTIHEADAFAIAYEPIWAIGTGLVPTVDDVAAMHEAIRDRLSHHIPGWAGNVRILYGGSVTGDNAADLLSVDSVDGALVGGASLTAAKFVPIISAAAALG
jgi:triosephosphate isomerase